MPVRRRAHAGAIRDLLRDHPVGALLGIESADTLLGHPKVGASCEVFLLAQVTARLDTRQDECRFWATHQGAELDLLVVRGRRRLGCPLERRAAPEVTRWMHLALEDLRLDSLTMVQAGRESWPMADRIHAVAASRIGAEIRWLA